MNQLSGKYVNVVLSVECGRGMDFLRNNVFITANFNGRILESDTIPPDESPAFNTELVWEVEKKELRKIRCGNVPLRVECITVDPLNRKERIGFALLSLRSAKIVPQVLADQPVVSTWHKLIGCQADKRKCHPELYISLSVRDHMVNEQVNIDCQSAGMPFILEEDIQSVEEQLVTKECLIKYFENGHIQIGDDDVANISYTLNLTLVEVFNLDSLLTESIVFHNNSSSSFFLTFKILGIIIKTKPFENQMCDHVLLNEKIVVNLLSAKEILEDFLKTQAVSISFYHGYDKLGITRLNFDKIWNKEAIKYFFKIPDGVVPFEGTDKSPYISIEAWIEENNDVKEVDHALQDNGEELIEKTKTRSIFSNVCKTSARDIDYKNIHNTEEPEKPQEPVVLSITKSVDTVIVSETSTDRSLAVFDSYEKFIIIINLKYLIWTSSPPDNKIMFKFLHPRAGNCTTIFTEVSINLNEEIPLNNLYVRIAYISSATRITQLLKYWRPKLVLADKNEKYMTDKRTIKLDFVENGSVDYEEEFISLNNSFPLAKIGLNVNLNVSDITIGDDYENLFLLPVIVDDVITVNEIIDLEKWKHEYKILFQNESENIRKKEIARLQDEYETKRKELQDKLNESLEKCKTIQDQLKKKVTEMKIDKEFKESQRSSKDLYEKIFKENWKRYSENSVQQLIEVLSKTQRDNVLLKEMCEKHQEKLSKIGESTHPKAQSDNLLQELEKLEEQFMGAQAAKCYLKEILAKSCEASNSSDTAVDKSSEGVDLRKYKGFYTEQVQFE